MSLTKEDLIAIADLFQPMLQPIKEDLQELKNDTKMLKSDVQMLKEEVHVLKDEVHTLKDEVHILKDEVQVLKGDVQVLKDKVQVLGDDVQTLKQEVQMLNVTNRNIKIIAEGHLDLSRRLHEALKVENEREIIAIRVNILEGELQRMKAQLNSDSRILI